MPPVNHHEQGVTCPLCNEKREDLHPTLQTWWDRVKAQYPDEHLAWTFRNEENQNAFYQTGKTKAKWPGSKHNAMKDGKPCAEAWDSFRLRADGIAEFKRERYEMIWEWLKAQGAPIEWAGNWVGFKESDHFQLAKV